jgi:RNA polymerase sigma factor (TIGR02999 family)
MDNSSFVAADPPLGPIQPLVGEVYDELRRLARRYMQQERVQSIQATDLVHEAYLRLAKDKPRPFQNRAHFVAIAAIAMRRLLVERARARRAVKRGGGEWHVTLNDDLLAGEGSTPTVDLVALDRALTRLAAVDPTLARVVDLRFFGGMSIEETAEAMEISPATVKRHWTLAKAWLLRDLDGGDKS